MYKVISKALANRLTGVIFDIIDACQFAFVGGRNMLDSVLVTNEVVLNAKKKQTSTFVLKIDYEKVYDSVDWVF